ncbi:MAG: hypothetical protein KME01_15020 [Chroococcus sp. CMT-3BRIN-NPC107]|jgi:superfamily II DNA or RNA helicase|nr:hypothetical protein [Chroococcus sp. CMT-3BRIN-NPC107]
MQTVQVKYKGQVKVSTGKNPRELYPHQNEAIKALDRKSNLPFEGLLVLPTGGGKTLNTVRLRFVIANVLDKTTRIVAFQHLTSLSF